MTSPYTTEISCHTAIWSYSVQLPVYKLFQEQRIEDEKKETGKTQANQVLDMVLKGFQAYQESKGKKGEPSKKDAQDLYGEAFLQAFRISSEIARAMGKGQAKVRPAGREPIDAYGAAFVQRVPRCLPQRSVKMRVQPPPRCTSTRPLSRHRTRTCCKHTAPVWRSPHPTIPLRACCVWQCGCI